MKLILKAMSPISHAALGEEKIGNYTAARQIPLVNLSGYPKIPVISGNAIRGKMRRAIMNELYKVGNVKFEKFAEAFGAKKAKKAWDKIYAALFIGGTIDSVDVNIHSNDIRTFRKKCPPLSVFGSALYSIMIPGVANIGFAIPFCEETVLAGIWDLDFTGSAPKAADLICEIGLTRHPDRENADPKLTGVKPMPYIVEAISIGTKFCVEINFSPTATEIERGCVIHASKLINTIGGKISMGFGRISTEAIADSCSENEYIRWLEENKNCICDNIIEIAQKVIK